MRYWSIVLSVLLSAGCGSTKPGILVLAHGGDAQWNEEVMATIDPLRADYPTEVAFGMATPSSIETAVRRLEARGVNKIAVARMFVSGDSFLQATEYILGLGDASPSDPHSMRVQSASERIEEADDAPPESPAVVGSVGLLDGAGASPSDDGADHHHMEAPRRIRASAQFVVSRRGVAESPLINQILVDRVRVLSREPTNESVLVLGHGPGDDAENERWLATMRQRAVGIGQVGSFRSVRCETLREDWPEKRADAEERIRRFVADGSQNGGRVIVVPFRVSGFGPYEEVLAGLDYVADGKGFCPHANMTRWLRETARETLAGH